MDIALPSAGKLTPMDPVPETEIRQESVIAVGDEHHIGLRGQPVPEFKQLSDIVRTENIIRIEPHHMIAAGF